MSEEKRPENTSIDLSPDRSAAPRIIATLRIAEGKADAEEVFLSPSSTIVIGRTGDCGIRLSDPRISRMHAILRSLEHEVLLCACGARNATYLTRRGLTARITEHVKLQSGDVLTIGRASLTFTSAAVDLPW